jgi:hypothetical protein
VLSLTRRALEDFDNQHDFERMAADILNALGYAEVEPMAPGGGRDRGRDIRYVDGDGTGIAFVTLEKKIRAKFARDLEKISPGESMALSLFCNVDVSPALKVELSRLALEKGSLLTVYDLERLRSLLDTSLTEIRRRVLHIDDDVSQAIRSKVSTILRFPDAEPLDTSTMSLLETMLVDPTPAKLFAVLREYSPETLRTIPEIGAILAEVQSSYYEFKRLADDVFELMMTRVSGNVGVRFRQGWRIYVQYAFMRSGGATREQIESGGDFLNFGITWNDAERVAELLQNDADVAARVQALITGHEALVQKTRELQGALGV